MEAEKTTIEKYREDLTADLMASCTDAGLLKGMLLSSPDIDEAWLRYAPSFYGDAVRNFNAYPEYCLACAGFIGMAVAFLWDKDWAKYMEIPYSFFQGERGFDDMDDHITGKILRESRHSVAAMQSLSAEAWHFLLRKTSEPGTVEAYKLFLAAVKEMFRIGAAIELYRLGYRLEQLN